jgi:hypothetical protein
MPFTILSEIEFEDPDIPGPNGKKVLVYALLNSGLLETLIFDMAKYSAGNKLKLIEDELNKLGKK